ncbi:MAG: DUF2142 domain-containing protein [Chloroflexi bacterium]|nr:DUF2142 domain-containing protein [Chloroflexota bacterium]
MRTHISVEAGTYSVSNRWCPTALVGVLVAYFILATVFSLATPILEASDENSHTAVVWTIASGHGLPVLSLADRGKVLVPAQEAGQPPLYYLIIAAATSWIHFPSPARSMLPNPYSQIGHPNRSGWDKNLVIHTSAENFPWRGLSLAVHLGRFVSIVFGAITVLLVYLLARIVAPGWQALHVLAAALTAFNPMFLFITASIDNDSLACLLATVVIVLLAQTLVDGQSTARRELVIGFCVGLAALTKLSAGAVMVPAALTLLWLAWYEQSWRRAVRSLILLALPALLLDGWWIARNWMLYANPTGLNTFLAIAGQRSPPLTLREFIAELPGVWISFWGVFGIFDILLPRWYYKLAGILGALSLLGLLVSLLRRRSALISRRAHSVLLWGWLGLEAVLLVLWTRLTLASTGRLLFPAIGSTSIFFAIGLIELQRRARSLIAGTVAGALAGGAALTVPFALLPAYAQPPFVPAINLHPATRLGFHYGNLELVGVDRFQGAIHPGSTVHIRLYWLKRGMTNENDVVSVQLHGPDRLLIAQTDALPGGGKVLTTAWPDGLGLVDSVPLTIPSKFPPGISGAFLGRISVYVYPEYLPNQRIPATTDTNQVISNPLVETDEVRSIAPLPSPTPLSQQVGITFGGRIALASVKVPAQVSAGGILPVTLQWLAKSSPGGSYAVTLTGRDSHGHQAFAVTSIPHSGLLPTSDWVPGEVVEDTLDVPLAASIPLGRYDLSIGLVNLRTGAYLTADDGTAEAHIGQVNVIAAPPNERTQSVDPQLTYGALRLVQMTFPAHPVAPGKQITVTLLWRVEHHAADNDAFSVQLHSPEGTLLAQRDLQPGGAVPTFSWPAGLDISNVVPLKVLPNAPSPSLALLSVYVYPLGHPDQPTLARTAAGRPEPQPIIAHLVVRSSTGQTSLPPSLPLRINVTFGRMIRLLSAAVPDHVEAGKLLDITLQWEAIRGPTADYTIFIHALDPGGRLIFQLDTRPHGGKLPTNDWVTGEVVTDHFSVPVPASTAPGVYRIVVGLYQLQTGKRLTLADGHSEYTLKTTKVMKPVQS